MGAKSARKYYQAQARSVVDSIDRILRRINPKYTPNWLYLELHHVYQQSQCILAERERDMQGYKDEIKIGIGDPATNTCNHPRR